MSGGREERARAGAVIKRTSDDPLAAATIDAASAVLRGYAAAQRLERDARDVAIAKRVADNLSRQLEATVRAAAEGLSNGDVDGQVPRATPFDNLSEDEFAKLMGVSSRTIAKDRKQMTENVHYHRNGRRVLYHATVAQEFIRQRRARITPTADPQRLAVDEVTIRRAKVALKKVRGQR